MGFRDVPHNAALLFLRQEVIGHMLEGKNKFFIQDGGKK